MNNNGTNYTNASRYDDVDQAQKQAVKYAFYTTEISLIVVGTLLNLWFLVAILTSRDMRSRLRNKIICNTMVLQLLDSALVIPVSLSMGLNGYKFGCTIQSAIANLELIQDFIVNWLLVMLLVVFIAQIQDFNPKMRLTPMAVTLGTLGMLVLPWVVSLIVVPVIVHEYYFSLEFAQKGCSYPTQDAMQLFKSIDTAAPIILAVLLVILAAALRYRRFTCDYSFGSIQAELISRGPEIDETSGYVAAVVISSICDLLRLLFSLDLYIFSDHSTTTWWNLVVVAWILSDARVVLMLLPWLFFADIRQRIKTWRPWHRESSAIELTVTYRKDEM